MEVKLTCENEKDIISKFTNHIPDPVTLDQMATVRTGCRSLARIIDELCPDSREKATAIYHLQLVMMMANSSIVQKCPVNCADLSLKESENYNLILFKEKQK